MDGCCPLAAYLGEHGFCLELALRPGTQHSAAQTEFNVERIVPMAQRLGMAGPKAPGLPPADRLIKWSPRGTDAAGLAERLDAGLRQSPRPGKRVALWEDALVVPGIEHPLRRVLRLVERTIDRRGQQLLVAEYELEGWSGHCLQSAKKCRSGPSANASNLMQDRPCRR